jgi:hypothetical protein
VKLFAALVGLLAGLLAGVLLIAMNPLERVGRLPPLPVEPAPEVKRYTLADVAGFPIGLAQLLGRSRPDEGLTDAPNRGVRIGLAVLPAGDGRPAALAVKASMLSPQNSLWKARLGTLDYWVIAWPGEGVVFATGYSNFWSLGRDVLWSVLAGPGALDDGYAVSAVPPATDDGGIHGASGRFRGATGSLRETLEPQVNGPPAWTLALAVDAPETR